MKNLLILILIIFAFPLSDIYSQNSDTIKLQKKAALVIGNGNYLSSVLSNPENDARAMENVLKKLGFVVYKYENLNQIQMKQAIDEFGEKLKNNDIGLFFYAGHGIQFNGYNYLIPVDARLTTEYDCVQADRILALMEGSGAKVNIIIFDACRNNPFERSWTRSATGKGLAFMNAPKGTLIAYATSPGSTASDGSGRNGLYTSAILECIEIPKITILQMFQQVRSIVSQKSNDSQTPWESTSLTGDFYFNFGDPATAISPVKNDITELNNNPPQSQNSKLKNYPSISSENDWEKVEILDNKPDIKGLIEVKKIKASSSLGGFVLAAKGIARCKQDLQKQAAALGCPIVYLTVQKAGVTTVLEGFACKVNTEK
jgi:hypothetical protein